MKSENHETEVMAGQLVAQNMLIQMLMGHLVLMFPDHDAGIREALVQGVAAMRANPNMTSAEKFGAVKTLEDGLDTLDRIEAAARLQHKQ